MALIKAKFPMIAPVTEDDNGGYTLGTGIKIGKLISMDINPIKAEGELYGDDGRAENVTEYVGADVTLNTTTVPPEARPVMFGETHTAATTGENATPETVVSSGDDNGQYVAYGFIRTEINNNVKKYVYVLLIKVKFTLPDEHDDTKGDSIQFNTPSITGKADTIEGGNSPVWRKLRYYDSESDALAALKTEFNYSE